mgnify:CR=1 FL=1
MKKRVLHLLGVFRPARHPEQHKADDEQHRDAAHAHVALPVSWLPTLTIMVAQEGCPLAADVEQAEVFAGFFRRDDLGKVLRLSACTPPWNNPTITASTQNCHCWVRKKANTAMPV